MTDEDDDREQQILAKIVKYKQMMNQVDGLTARRIRSLIDDLEQIVQQTKQSRR